MTSGIRLNIGCGPTPDPDDGEWIRLDADPRWKPDVLHNILFPLPFEDNSVDLIYAAHVLEHVSYHKTLDILKDWNRVLKPGGRLSLRVPDGDNAIDTYLQDPKVGPNYLHLHFLFYSAAGGVYSYHRALFCQAWLEHLLALADFTVIERVYTNNPLDLFLKAEKNG